MQTTPKILIIDDEEVVRETLEILLSAEDLELLFAENGEIGIRMAEEFLPDAVLLDVMMPGMDGFETCRQIRTRPALAEIPIIMITALDSRDARLTGLMAGADDFLNKPFDGVEIQIRVRNIMRINRYRNLMAERSRFLWVVENDNKGYIVLGENGNIVYANQRAQVFFHLPEEYSHINFGRQAERYYQPHVPEDGQNYRTVGRSSYLVQPETATARAFWLRVEVMSFPLGVNNQRLVRITDVTDEMSTYQDIRKIHLLVAHKLRTPVSNIYTSMAILNAQIQIVSDEEVKPMVQAAWVGAERLVKDVRDILKYIDAPVALADGKPLYLHEISRIINMAGEALEIKKISFSLPDELAGLQVSMSLNAMELIIYELFENSKKFHPTQTPAIQVSVNLYKDNEVVLQFLDDGQTMTAEQITRAKLPYSQSEKWFTGEVSGMGLGLPLIATLTWQAGGQARVANREDQPGVCVRLLLPLLR